MKQSLKLRWDCNLGVANAGKRETFIKNKMGVATRWCAEMRKCETVTGISMGAITWRWTKGGESVKHSSKTGGGCNSVVCRDAKMRNSHRNQYGGYNLAVDQRRGKCETFIINRMGL